jgi:hypothetical protein
MGFRLRFVGRGHALFHIESLLNTPLFVGFPGYRSKIWLAHDQSGRYRGIYEWDGPQRAEHHARSLWRVLGLGCVPESIGFRIFPSRRRDEFLQDLHLDESPAGADAEGWWQPVKAL